MLGGGNRSPTELRKMMNAIAAENDTNLETFREIGHLEVGCLLKFGQVDQELVGNSAIAILVSQGVMAREPARHVISVEQRNL